MSAPREWDEYGTVGQLRAMLAGFPDDAPAAVTDMAGWCVPIHSVQHGDPTVDQTPGTEFVAHVWLDYPDDATP